MHCGITGNTHKWIEAFLTHTTMRVTVNGVLSPDAQVTSRIPQDTVLGPLLFLIFINPKCAGTKLTRFN